MIVADSVWLWWIVLCGARSRRYRFGIGSTCFDWFEVRWCREVGGCSKISHCSSVPWVYPMQGDVLLCTVKVAENKLYILCCFLDFLTHAVELGNKLYRFTCLRYLFSKLSVHIWESLRRIRVVTEVIGDRSDDLGAKKRLFLSLSMSRTVWWFYRWAVELNYTFSRV